MIPPHICSMCIKTNQVGKQEVGIWWVQKRYPQYGIPVLSLWPNIRFVSSIVAEKNVTKNPGSGYNQSIRILKINWAYRHGYSFCLNFFHLLARKPYLEKNSIYLNKFFHNFHLSESSFTCPGLRASGLARRMWLTPITFNIYWACTIIYILGLVCFDSSRFIII
jgi:hypothetical protein